MSKIVEKTIEKINSFKDIDELHEYIINDLDLNVFTDEEFIIVWKHMNKFENWILVNLNAPELSEIIIYINHLFLELYFSTDANAKNM